MPAVDDQDRFFTGQSSSSVPRHVLGEGSIARLINGRFVEGAITNGVGFDELVFNFPGAAGPAAKNTDRLFASNVTYEELLRRGDIQLFAPMQNVTGTFLVVVLSGRLILLDLKRGSAWDVTPVDAFLPPSSTTYRHPLSYLDNDGGTFGVGGYLVIFNYPNRPIFVNHIEARPSRAGASYEMPPMRLGVTGATRAFTISGDNLMWASDPVGGASSLAPLTYAETLSPDGDFKGQIFTIGSALDIEYVTNVSRLPRFSGPTQEFLAYNILVSTENKKFTISAGFPRATWETGQFINYVGSLDGIAGPEASTNIGDVLIYMSTTGRIKSIAQDQERETGLTENFLDDPLGQYMCHCEANFYFRDWYRTLNHSRSGMKFNKDRLYTTVYPFYAPAIGQFGQAQQSYSHRALAVASLDPETDLGERASFTWEGFYDWLQPTHVAVIDGHLHVFSKDVWGRNKIYRENFTKVDDHPTTIYTRGYFAGVPGKSKSLMKGTLYFRKLAGPVKVTISYLVNDVWICGAECEATSKLLRFNITRNRCRTDSWGIPLKIDIDHGGCRFELESIRVDGETHSDEKIL